MNVYHIFFCSTALHHSVRKLCIYTSEGLTHHSTLLNFSKAFQSIVHKYLLSKLSSFFNFSEHAIQWVQNYLQGRQQFVSIPDSQSSLRNLPSGDPQGTVLGPLLFCLYINDLPNALKYCKHHLYANDFQMYTSCDPRELTATINSINDDLARITDWAALNGLSINPLKSQCIIFSSKRSTSLPDYSIIPSITVNNTTVPFSSTVNNLGLTLDRHL